MKLSSCSRLLTAGLVLSGAAFAQGDECATATTIATDTPTPFDTSSATPSVPDFTASCGAGGGSTSSQDVWFKFTATADYTATASTCGIADYDSKIEVYDGSCGALVTVGCNDDFAGCAGFTSQAGFAAVNGTEYYIRIGGWGATDAGTGSVVVTGPPAGGTPNDDCDGAITIVPDTPTDFDTSGATPSTPDFDAACGAGGGSTSSNDVWFKFTAASSYIARATTCGTAAYDTKIAVYDGSCGALALVGCNDDFAGCTGFTSQVDFAAVSGTEYYIRIGGWSTTDAGDGQILLTDQPPALENDDCGGAIAIGLGQTSLDSVGATDSGVDMSCVTSGEAGDVWYSYTAIGDCPVTVDLTGTFYDTGLSVYSGDCAALTEVGCDDDGGGGLTSKVTFAATAGTTYYIQVGGFNGATGVGIITLSEGVGSVVCLGNANSTGAGALLRACGSDVATDNALSLEVTDLPLNQNVLFVNSQETILVSNPGGSQGDLCIGSLALGRHVNDIVNSGAAGTASLALDLANVPTNLALTAVVAGETWYWQAWYRDESGGTPTSNLSSAVGVTFN